MNVIINNRTANEPLQSAPSITICPGSGVVMPGRGPLFIPEWLTGTALLTPVVVLRLCRLGKNIEQRFAPRYYDAMAAGVLMRPTADEGIPPELAAAADSAMALGAWLPLDASQPIRVDVDTPRLSLTLSQQELAVDPTITAISRFMTLRMGDLMVPALPPVHFEAQRDVVMKIALNGITSLDVKIK